MRDIDLGLFFSSISSFTSCLFALEIFNTKLNRYAEDASYARHGPRSRKNIAKARERWAKASRIVYISWLNKISSKDQIGSTCMGPLASEITFAKKKLYHVQKQLLYLLELNFERILHNTKYVLRCLKTVRNFWFSKSGNFCSLC